MASPVGGRFTFTDGIPVHLGLKNPGHLVSPVHVTGDLNIEVFTGITTLPTKLGFGFQQGVIVSDTVPGDAPPHLIGTGSKQTLTGQQLRLFGGSYTVTDTNTVPGHTARITASYGHQTVIGAKHDTLLGGSGTNQLLGGWKGSESIIGGRSTYTVVGGAHDTIKGSKGATSITAGHIAGGAGSMAIQIGKAGKYTVTSGAGDTITSASGSGSATITGVHSDHINLNGNTGTVSVVGTSSGADTIIAGRGHETIRGGPGDRIGVGYGNTVGGTLRMSHSNTAVGAIEFGSNDTVHSTTYNTKTDIATRGTKTGTSSAHVTVTNFRVGVDSLFYRGETATLNHDIVVTAHNVTTSAGTGAQIILPDGTRMTLIGVTTTQLATQQSLGHLFKV